MTRSSLRRGLVLLASATTAQAFSSTLVGRRYSAVGSDHRLGPTTSLVPSSPSSLPLPWKSASQSRTGLEASQMSAPSTPERPPKVPTTWPEAHAVFWTQHAGPPLVILSMVVLAWQRVACASWSGLDVVVGATALAGWWLQEYVLHRYLLHSSFDWMGKEIHQSHHQDQPYHHVSIEPAALILGWLAVAHVAFLYALPSRPLALTATLAYAAAGLLYEWIHFVVHTRVPLQSRWGRALKMHHSRHHQVDQRYWLAFTLPILDDWFGTNPTLSQRRQEAAE